MHCWLLGCEPLDTHSMLLLHQCGLFPLSRLAFLCPLFIFFYWDVFVSFNTNLGKRLSLVVALCWLAGSALRATSSMLLPACDFHLSFHCICWATVQCLVWWNYHRDSLYFTHLVSFNNVNGSFREFGGLIFENTSMKSSKTALWGRSEGLVCPVSHQDALSSCGSQDRNSESTTLEETGQIGDFFKGKWEKRCQICAVLFWWFKKHSTGLCCIFCNILSLV